MASLSAVGRVFAPVAREWWLYPLGIGLYAGVPAAFGLYADLGAFAYTLLLTSLLALFCAVPIHLAYAHLWPRLLGETDLLAPKALLAHAVLIYAGVRFGGFLAYQAFQLAGGDFARFPFDEWGDTGLYMGLGFMTVAAAIMVSIDRHRKRIQELEVRELQAQQQSLAAQLQALQARVHPHFLFNCLNTVASLIQEDPKRAETMVERLSDLFRYTLNASRSRFVPIEAEMEAVRGFLELETLRYGDRLKAAVQVDPGAEGATVPPLCVQPLVENAVLHGIASRREGGRLEVQVERRDDRLRITVDDDGPGPGGSHHTGTGTGLADLRQRLGILYGDAAALELSRGPLGGCRLLLDLPHGHGGSSA